ncbi:MAG TPA: hypothetical protein VNI01_10120 [Elusimicrobiota bacterium]|jgi:hypothetical protein|nr:hypothetical protein [Elusimicrobiota bacterium]
MAGVNTPGTLYLGNLPATPRISIGRGDALVVDNSTSPATITLAGDVKNTPVYAFIQSTTTQNVLNATNTSIMFNALDTARARGGAATSGWGTVNLPTSALTVPKSGMYRVEFQVSWFPDLSATGFRDVWFEVNSAAPGTTRPFADASTTGLVGATTSCNGSMTLRLNQGDVVSLAGAQTSGVTIRILCDGTTVTSCFGVIYDGP